MTARIRAHKCDQCCGTVYIDNVDEFGAIIERVFLGTPDEAQRLSRDLVQVLKDLRSPGQIDILRP